MITYMKFRRSDSNTHDKTKDFGVLLPFEIPGWRWQLILFLKAGVGEHEARNRGSVKWDV